jgi:TonB family protein
VVLAAPRRLRADAPPYPSASRPCREEGKVGMTFCVAADGHVENAQVVSSSGYARLDNAALGWIQGARYAPGTINGAARRYCGMHIEQEFELLEDEVEAAALVSDAG